MSNEAFGDRVRKAALIVAVLVCLGLAGLCVWLQRDLAAKKAEARRLGVEAKVRAEQVEHLRQEINAVRERLIEANDAPLPQQHEATVVRERDDAPLEPEASETSEGQ